MLGCVFRRTRRSVSQFVSASLKTFGSDSNKIGVFGFLVGGRLAFVMANEFDAKTCDPIDDTDRVDPKPDFASPIYPEYLLEDLDDFSEFKLFNATIIDSNAPPHLIAVASDDANFGLASAILCCELKRKGIPVELHIPLKGRHCFGVPEDKRTPPQSETKIVKNGFTRPRRSNSVRLAEPFEFGLC